VSNPPLKGEHVDSGERNVPEHQADEESSLEELRVRAANDAAERNDDEYHGQKWGGRDALNGWPEEKKPLSNEWARGIDYISPKRRQGDEGNLLHLAQPSFCMRSMSRHFTSPQVP
jgi:hypothetical protein